jgi:hypothetical protein
MKFWVAHPLAIDPDVVDTVPRLLVIACVGMQRFDERAPASLIEFIVALLNPDLPRFALAPEDLAHGAQVLFGMKAVENLSGLGK